MILSAKIEMATVKVDENTYAELNRLAGELRALKGRPVPIDEVIRALLRRKRPSNFVGAWKMNDEEDAKIFGDLRRGWKKWKPTA